MEGGPIFFEAVPLHKMSPILPSSFVVEYTANNSRQFYREEYSKYFVSGIIRLDTKRKFQGGYEHDGYIKGIKMMTNLMANLQTTVMLQY